MLRKKALILCTIRSAGTKPIVCIVNTTNSYKSLKKNKVIAETYGVGSILEEQPTNKAISQSEDNHSSTVHTSMKSIRP